MNASLQSGWWLSIKEKLRGQECDAAASERFFAIVTFLLIFIGAARTPADTDMWWHLRAGDETLRLGRPLLSDPFSFTAAGQAWINHSWLSEVGMALLYRAGGIAGLCAVVALLATLSLALVYAQMEGPVLLRSFILVLAMVVAAPVWSPRPQMLSLVFMALTALILYRFKWKAKEALWTLPVLFMLWSNFHGGYPLGLLVCGAMIAGEIGNHLLGYTDDQVLSWRKILRLSAWTAAGALAVLINPNGFDMWRIPFQTVEVNVLQRFIVEWASPDFHDLSQLPFLWMLMALVAAIGLSRKRLDGTDLVTVVLFGAMGLLARRNIGPFAVATTPVLARHFWAAYQDWNERTGIQTKITTWIGKYSSNAPLPGGLRKVINLGGAAFLIFCAFWKVYGVSHPALVESQISHSQPVAAVQWMKANHLSGNLLNEYSWGGYLDWYLRDSRVFVDGRTDLFGDRIIGDWIQLVQAQPGWEQTFQQYPVDFVLLEPGQPITIILQDAGWQPIFQDDVSVLLQR